DAREQLLDAQLLGPDAFDRRDRPLQHVVAALELAGAFDRDDVTRLFDDAEDACVAPVVAAERAELALADVEALPAPRDALLRVDDRGREPTGGSIEIVRSVPSPLTVAFTSPPPTLASMTSAASASRGLHVGLHLLHLLEQVHRVVARHHPLPSVARTFFDDLRAQPFHQTR